VAELASHRYSAAFFDLGLSSGKLESFATDARLVLDILASEEATKGETLSDFLYHPQISEGVKTSVVESVLRGKVNDETLGLVAVVIKKQRERELTSVFEAFIKLVNDHNELAEAHITSAVPIDEGRLETIRGILSDKFGKKIVLRTSVDKDLIGGFKVLILGNSFDRTIRTSIGELTASLS
jgi:F-type H+-transporting ATPase subunit delta